MRTTTNLLIVICLLWAGMIAGISFLEAPVKFTAPSLTLPVGLDVGRHVFAAFNKVEIFFGLTGLLLVFTGRQLTAVKLLYILVLVLLILQCLWLLPILDKRALAIIAGTPLKGSSPHMWYVVFEAIKLIGLILIGVFGNRAQSKFT